MIRRLGGQTPGPLEVSLPICEQNELEKLVRQRLTMRDVSKSAHVRCAECRDERTCGICMVMKDVRDATARILDQTSLADILKRVELTVEGKDALNYTI